MLFLFLLEHTIVQLVPILIAIVFGSFFLRPLLRYLEVGVRKRVAVYSLPGMVGGLWSYSSLTIPDRSFELTEIVLLGVSMYLFSVLLVYSVVSFSNRSKRAPSENQED
jgi:hypothetical protein